MFEFTRRVVAVNPKNFVVQQNWVPAFCRYHVIGVRRASVTVLAVYRVVPRCTLLLVRRAGSQSGVDQIH